MNYYKQGDAANADKIKAAFEKLGIDVLDFGFADKTVVYCSIGECVQYLPYSINLMNILYSHPDYKELELAVEPKFKVGDWIVRKDGITFYGGNHVEQITSINGNQIYLSSGPWVSKYVIRLWTIQDAKDGDVLTTGLWTFVYKYSDNNLSYYHFAVSFKGEISTNDTGSFTNNCITPANKEQRDLFFAKMKEVGYEWDAVNKELKKIQSHYDISNFKPFDKVLVRDGCEK